jgi:hypothetical protein
MTVEYLSKNDFGLICSNLPLSGGTVFCIRIEGCESLFDLASILSGAVPVDPPIFGRSWDALSDSIFGGLAQSGLRNALLVFSDLGELRKLGAEQLSIFVEILGSVIDQLAAPKPAGANMRLRVILLDDDAKSSAASTSKTL